MALALGAYRSLNCACASTVCGQDSYPIRAQQLFLTKKGAQLSRSYRPQKTVDIEAEFAKEAKMANTCVLNVKRLTDHASLPTRGSVHAAGYDLYRCVVCSRQIDTCVRVLE